MYKIDTSNLKRQKLIMLPFLIFAIFFILIALVMFINSNTNFSIISIPMFLFVPIIFILISFKAIKGANDRIKKIKYLEKHGKLVKGLNYKMVYSNISINHRRLLRIEVNYVNSRGDVIELYSEPRYDYKYKDEDGLVDLLIDPNDESNYYIDFEIKEELNSKDAMNIFNNDKEESAIKRY